MEYILAPKGGGCIFCGMAGAEPDAMRKALVLVATDTAFVVLNRYPFTAGHLLVVPKRHAADLSSLPADEHDALFRLVRESAACLTRAVLAEGLNVGLNIGQVAGAGLAEHLHVHLVPRWGGDTNFMPILSDVRVMPQYLEETFERLAPHFEGVRGVHPQ
jgi:ATP adenylyltransferase